MWATDHEYTCTVPKSQETKEPGSQKDQETRGPDIRTKLLLGIFIVIKRIKEYLIL